jgi:hypothetical protein
MALIAPIVIGCIDYLAYGTIFTRAMFLPKIKLEVFFPARKAADERWEVRGGSEAGFEMLVPKKHSLRVGWRNMCELP